MRRFFALSLHPVFLWRQSLLEKLERRWEFMLVD
jgi:hypothetical protein